MNDLAPRTRKGRLVPDGVAGGTFTISKPGTVRHRTIHRHHQSTGASILAVGATRPEPLVDEEGQIVVRPVMQMILSTDHRVVGGTVGVRFLTDLQEVLGKRQCYSCGRNTPMPEITLTVRHKAGLHARPAALFVQTAKQFNSDIEVTHGEKEANAKSILSVLALGVDQGAVITIRAEGENADQALEALEALIESNFGEGE